MTYPSGNGRCYRSGKAASVNSRHQTNFCLSGEHETCPYLLKMQAKLDQQAAAPKAVEPKTETPLAQAQPKPASASKPRPAKSAPPRMPAAKSVQIRKPVSKSPIAHAPAKKRKINLSNISLGIYGVLMTIAMVAVLAWGASLAGADLPALFAAPRVQEPSLQPTATETQEAYMPAVPSLPMVGNNIFLATPTRVSPTPSSTGQKAASTPLAAIRTLAPTLAAPTTVVSTTEACGAPFGWVQYVVRAGDTLSSLSRDYNVSVNQLQAANCMGSSISIYAGAVISVPFYMPPSYPTLQPTLAPAATSTMAPTAKPTAKPTAAAPTDAPTPAPTATPTEAPTPIPTTAPTDTPTVGSTEAPAAGTSSTQP